MSVLDKLKRSAPPPAPSVERSSPATSVTVKTPVTTAAMRMTTGATKMTDSLQKPKSGQTSTPTASYECKPRPNDGKRIKVGVEYGVIINDMAMQYYVRFDSGDTAYVMKSTKHKVM